jgi:hypothetical protein
VTSRGEGEGAAIEVRRGSRPIVVYAPHGGRRKRPVRRGDNVNDLHTAEIARELAERLDAFALINASIDRNDADLNRVGMLTDRATHVLAQLRTLAEEAGRGGVVPLVLIVHGWNVTVPACDLGMGLVERDGVLHGRNPTLARATLDGFAMQLARTLRGHGIDAPIGRRYSASGRDNATQLFSGRHREHAHPDAEALSKLAHEGGIDAIQLELAIPLRWPGAWRDRFVDTLVELASAEGERRSRGDAPRCSRTEWKLPPIPKAARADRWPPGYSIQTVLPDGGGLFAGAEAVGSSEAAARLCWVRPDGTLVLFVGEGSWSGDAHRYAVGGLDLEGISSSDDRTVERVRVRYAGPIVVYPTHDAFCDLELGLAGARLASAKCDVELEQSGESFATMQGYLSVGDEMLELRGSAVCERSSRRAAGVALRSRVFVTAGPLAPARVVAYEGDDVERIGWSVDADAEVDAIRVGLGEGDRAHAHVVARVPVYRVIAGRYVVKVTFGTATIDGAPGTPPSLVLFERVEAQPLSAASALS